MFKLRGLLSHPGGHSVTILYTNLSILKKTETHLAEIGTPTQCTLLVETVEKAPFSLWLMCQLII